MDTLNPFITQSEDYMTLPIVSNGSTETFRSESISKGLGCESLVRGQLQRTWPQSCGLFPPAQTCTRCFRVHIQLWFGYRSLCRFPSAPASISARGINVSSLGSSSHAHCTHSRGPFRGEGWNPIVAAKRTSDTTGTGFHI